MKQLIINCLALLSGAFLRAQQVYELTAPTQWKTFRSDHLKMGGACGDERIEVNSYYMSMNGQPVIPVMGEFHYSRYPADQWEEELRKMKAGGITVVPTYVFWNIHEEHEGQFRWDGNRDLRRFLQLCQKHGLQVIIRIGPWCHGEIRNGGFPDWLFAKNIDVRSNDPQYLEYVRRLYMEIGRQMEGLFYKDGGPVIGCQLENELQHSAAPWAISFPKEPKDNTAASFNAAEASVGVAQQTRRATRAELGEQHLRTLKQMAVEAGIVTPFYTATGWGNAAIIPGETIPVTAAYTYATWTKPHPSPFLMFKDMQGTPDYSPVRYNPADYPSFAAEMGAGIQMTYDRRPYCYASTAEAMMVRCLGGGSNGIGYYMYHGGSTPTRADGTAYFSDEPMGVPKISYDFQAPLGEFGLEKPAYRNLRLIHLFLNDFGNLLAPMQTVLPASWEKMTPENRDDLRFCARMGKLDRSATSPSDNSSPSNSEKVKWSNSQIGGFLFMINAQDHDTLRHDQTGLQIKLNLENEELRIPASGTFTLPKDQSMILPFNLDMGGALLKYATAQLLMKIKDGGTDHYFFFSPEGMKTEYLFDKSTVKGKNLFRINLLGDDRIESTFTVRTVTGHTIKITTLTRQQALNATKVNGKLLITDATVLPADDGAELLSLGENKVSYIVYPSRQGFKPQTVSTEAVIPLFEVEKANSRRMSVKLLGNLTEPLDNSSPGNSMKMKWSNSQVHECFLRINYVGDVAMAFMNDQLVYDAFYYGEPWVIGLKRYMNDLESTPMTFYFRPLRQDAPFLGDLRAAAVPDFKNGPVVNIKSVEVVPEYKLAIKF